MSPYALLLRCLLIVTFCLDGSLSLWGSTAMAMHEVQHAVDIGDQAVVADVADNEDCEDGLKQGERGSAHEDCDCGLGSCDCACVFPAAAMTHPLPFMAQHALTSQPAPLSLAAVPPSAITPVFRPPIG